MLYLVRMIFCYCGIFCIPFAAYIAMQDIDNVLQLDKAIDVCMVGFVFLVAAMVIEKIQGITD